MKTRIKNIFTLNRSKTLDELWEEWRYTNEWKAARDFVPFEKFLDMKHIKYKK